MGDRVVVTGGTSPLGSVLCRSLAARGYHLVIHYCQRESEAKTLASECRGLGASVVLCRGDFSTPSGVEAFVAGYRSLAISSSHLINNASLYLTASLLATPEEQWYKLWQVNTTAPWLLTKALVADIRLHRGSVINIGVAGLGRSSANSYNPAYMLTKAALLQTTRSLAKELAPSCVRINMVSPGHLSHSVDLPFFQDTLPTGSPVSSDAVAAAVLFLISHEASSITGQNLEVAAGALL